MIPLRDNLYSRNKPIVTWTLIALNVLIFFWDRQWSWSGMSVVFSDLVMRPVEVLRALSGGSGGDLFEVGKIFTSMFLHVNATHLIGNMLFLFAFGENVEAALGGLRFAIYYLFWGVMASATHIFINPHSAAGTLGASGAIGGVLGCYFLLFPGNKVQIVIPPFVFWWFSLPAWILLGVWFLWQVVLPQPGVAHWAHVGGFLAGMLTVLIAGGREKLLKGTRFTRVALDDEL